MGEKVSARSWSGGGSSWPSGWDASTPSTCPPATTRPGYLTNSATQGSRRSNTATSGMNLGTCTSTILGKILVLSTLSKLSTKSKLKHTEDNSFRDNLLSFSETVQ